VEYFCRVGHLILTALTIWASDPQNALAWTSFDSPKSLPPLSYSLVSRAAFGVLSFFFLVNNFRNSRNIFPHFGCGQFTPFLNLLGEHALIRVLGKYRKTIHSQRCQACGRLRIITSMKNLTSF